MARNEVKYGALLSYVLIFANSIYGMIIAPFILSTVGTSEYGVYKAIGAMVASVSVLEMGIGNTMQRYIARFHALKDRNSAENFSAMGFIQACVMATLILFLSGGLYLTLDSAYPAFTEAEMLRAKQVFVLQMAHVALHLFENFFFGIISGYNRFVFSNSLKLITLVLRIVLYLVVLPIFPNATLIVSVVVAMEVLTIAAELLYISLKLKHRIRLKKWDKPLFRESFAYTLLLFIQSLVVQFNGNVDSYVVGAMIGTAAVSLYSFALQFYNMYSMCAMSVSNVLLPTVTNRVCHGATTRDLEDIVIKYGRIQWLGLGAAMFGFLCCGKSFFALWLGAGYEDCWLLSLILIVPATLPLITNVCLTILKAKNLMGFRTKALCYALILNIILTVVGTYFWGYWAAAAGTAASTIVGGIIAMHIYYRKKLQMNMWRVYRSIIHKTLPCLLLASLPCFILNRIMPQNWISFAVCVVAFLLVYAVALLFYGANPEEKKLFLHIKKTHNG